MGNERGEATILNEYKTYKESYKHAAAVKVLADWLRSDYIVKVEKYMGFDLVFKPDIAAYKNDILQAIYEVVHTNGVDYKKLGRIQYYAYVNNLSFLCHEVSAEWILRQTEKPDKITHMFTFQI